MTKLSRAAVLAALVLAVFTPSSASAQATTSTTNINFPIILGAWVPCANNGSGELVTLTGSLHAQFHLTLTPGGGFVFKSHANPQGVSGTGAFTGTKYEGTGVTQSQFGASGLPFHATFVNNFRLIGQGRGGNLTVHQNFHITVNANGELTAFVDNFRYECK